MNCRICGSDLVTEVGEVEYFSGYAWKVMDCRSCGCRFTRHDNSVYDLLHLSGAISYYAEYRDLADKAKQFFDRRDLAGLQDHLFNSLKYRFVINELAAFSRGARLLEIGCSRGYLTSWAILDGRNILGVDVSADAVESARAAFGDHFALADSPAVQAGAPYDLIYHVGMIGCVSDPVGLTKQLLGWLKPGGRLVFNAPNLSACYLKNQLWLDSAPPPDLVTLFPPGFWRRQFAELAKVREGIELLSRARSLELKVRNLGGRAWRPPHPQSLQAHARDSSWLGRNEGRVRRWFERKVGRLGNLTPFARFISQISTEFGLFVKMTPKTAHARSPLST